MSHPIQRNNPYWIERHRDLEAVKRVDERVQANLAYSAIRRYIQETPCVGCEDEQTQAETSTCYDQE